MSKTWSPARLPRLRDQTATRITNPAAWLSPTIGADDPAAVEALNALSRRLLVSELYWVTSPMAALAISSASTLDEVRWTTADRPSTFGLVVWDGGIGRITHAGRDAPVIAASWGPHPAGTTVCLFANRYDLDGGSGTGDIPPLVPVWGETYPTTADWAPAETLPEGQRTVLTALVATWTLMQQTTLAQRTQAIIDRDIRSSYGRKDLPEPVVSIIDLRRQYIPTAPPEDDDPSGGRRFRHRWVVNGHWRNQPYGPERANRRKQWIPAYVKGPDGAPLLETTRVNVWRR